MGWASESGTDAQVAAHQRRQREAAAARPAKPNLDRPQLRSHKPSGAVAAPVILLEGEEKAGKTWAAVLLSRDERVGKVYFLDLGEGTAEEYGAIPGAEFEVLEHDGTYASVLEQILAVKAEAKRAHDAGELPVALLIDSMTDEWDGLREWVNDLARAKPDNQRALAQDPAAELKVSRNLWNLCDKRHRRIITSLLTFPGIVVMTARGKEVSATDPSTGQPYRDGRKDYRVESQKNLAYDAGVWVRMVRGRLPQIIGCRSVHAGIKPGEDQPREVEGHEEDLLAWLIFDVLQYKAGDGVRTVRNFTGGELTDDEKAEEEPQQARRQQQAPPPRPTLQEARQAVLDRRQARATQRAEGNLPAVRAGQAHAWDAAGEVMPRGSQAERTKLVEDTLAGLQKTTADATAEEWHAAAEELEAAADKQLTATYTEESK